MKSKISLVLLCAAASVPASAATYWSGANGTEMAVVGDAGNAADTGGTAGLGSVGYEYSIGKYEVTNAQYANFLNVVGSTSVTLGGASVTLYGGLDSKAVYPGIGQNSDGTFSALSGSENKAVSYVSAYAAAMYCNWLGNGATVTSAYLTGAYDFSSGASMSVLLGVSADAIYRLPTENEWYKAAYYKGGSSDAGYWKYSTQSDSISSADANYGQNVKTITAVGSYEKSSAYGTFDQGGNVEEWCVQEGATTSLPLRGGSFDDVIYLDNLASKPLLLPTTYPTSANYNDGFRVASSRTSAIPEPSAFGLLAGAFALALCAARRRRRSR